MSTGRMRAARFYGPGQPLCLEEVPIPVPALGEALIRVRAAGICHTELHMLEGVLNLGVVPLIPGHEVVGEVVDVHGPSSLRPGQRVLLWYYAPCGSCSFCRGGAENLCPNAARQFGFTADGGYAEYLVAPVSSLLPLPDSLADAAAVGLACGGATALHAARAIAQVRLGETAVVYGVGGVGFYLIQICRLAGARVLAIGRSPDKLARARALGADACVDATVVEPLSAVQELTGGNGADVVFDLVASAETMAVGPRMLARRGRLVFTGYGEEHARLHPLLLVLREIQVRGAVGNTFAELNDTVALAASGQLQSVVGPSFELAQINQALNALREGEIVGRAVVDLTAGAVAADRAGEPRRPAGVNGPAVSPAVTSVPADPATSRSPRSSDPSPDRSPPVWVARDLVSPPAVVAPRPGPRPFEAELLDLIGRGVDQPTGDADFNALALGLFAYQYERNEPYRRFCDGRGQTPATVRHWTELPAVPIGAFKEVILATEPIEQAAACFMSSGTTRPEQRSRHYHPDLAVYNASTRTNFVAHVLPDGADLPFLVLNPRPSLLPNSSLAYYLGLMLDTYGAAGSDYFVDEAGLHHERLELALEDAVARGQPVCLLGTTFAFVHFLDRLAADGRRLALPPGSRVFDTGGVKGRSREISREELATALESILGIPRGYQVNMYGLTELSTQFIDVAIRQTVRGEPLQPFKSVPPWARVRVLDPETLEEVPPGTVGILCHTDLANRASVCSILTEDLGVVRGEGFEILGRVQGAAARGCSIALDELLTRNGRER